MDGAGRRRWGRERGWGASVSGAECVSSQLGTVLPLRYNWSSPRYTAQVSTTGGSASRSHQHYYSLCCCSNKNDKLSIALLGLDVFLLKFILLFVVMLRVERYREVMRIWWGQLWWQRGRAAAVTNRVKTPSLLVQPSVPATHSPSTSTPPHTPISRTPIPSLMMCSLIFVPPSPSTPRST